jgi:hypothetical protein
MKANHCATDRLNELCAASLLKIKDLTRDTKSFLVVLAASMERKTSLVEDPLFHDWIMGCLTEKSEVFKESKFFKSAVMENSVLAWKLCALLMSSLRGKSDRTGGHYVPVSSFAPVQTSPSK